MKKARRPSQPLSVALALIAGLTLPREAAAQPTAQVATPRMVVNATSEEGAFVTLSGTVTATTPSVNVTWAGPGLWTTFTLSAPYLPDNARLDNVLLPIGENQVVLTADDGEDVASAQMIVRVVRGVSVGGSGDFQPPVTYAFSPTDSFYYPADALVAPFVRVTLGAVSAPGLLALGVRDDQINPTVPPGYQLGSPPYYYDFLTTAAFGSATVCFDLTGLSFAAPATDLRLVHSTDRVNWAPVTPILNGNLLCGTTTSLGTYAIVTEANPSNAARTIAGTGFFRNHIDGPGGDVRDDLIDTETESTGSVAATGFGLGLALDAARGLLYWSDYGRIRRADLATGTMETIAGSDSSTDGTDGIPGLQAHLPNPKQLALDADGNIYFGVLCVVRRIEREAPYIITTVVGDGGCRHADGAARQASLDGSFALAFDLAGRMLIGEGAAAGRLRLFDPISGQVTTIAGNGTTEIVPGPALSSGLPHIRYLAVDPNNGDIYLAAYALSVNDYGDSFLLRLAGNPTSGYALSVLNTCVLTHGCVQRFGGDGGLVANAHLNLLTGVAVEPNGDILITEETFRGINQTAYGRIRRVSAADGTIQTVAGRPGHINNFFPGVDTIGQDFGLSSTAFQPAGLAVDPDGGFFFTNRQDDVRGIGTAGTSTPREADLAIGVLVQPATVPVGQPFSITVQIFNHGPDQSSGGQMALGNAPGLTVTAFQAPPGSTCQTLNGFSCSFGTLAQSSDLTFVLTFISTRAGSVAPQLTVATTNDPDLTNNVTSAPLVITAVATTVTTPTSSQNPSALGALVTFSATVTGFQPTGVMRFFADGNWLGEGQVDAAGVARVSTTALGLGNHAITAAYLGDEGHLASAESAALIQGVRGAAGVGLASPGPGTTTLGQTVTFTATVSGVTPSGTVTFMWGSAALRTVPLQLVDRSTATATFQTGTLRPGHYDVYAVYGGDANNFDATSGTVRHVVSLTRASGTAARAILRGTANNATVVSEDNDMGGFNTDQSATSAFDVNNLAVGHSFGAAFRGPRASVSSLTGGTLAGIGTGGARAVAYRTALNSRDVVEQVTGTAIVDGTIITPGIGHVTVATYIVYTDVFLGAFEASGQSLEEFLLGSDTLDDYAIGTEAALSLANKFPGGVRGSNFQRITASTPGTSVNVSGLVEPDKGVVIIFDIAVYAPPGAVVNFATTLKPGPVFLLDSNGNPSSMELDDSAPPEPPAPVAVTLAPDSTTAPLTTPVTLTATATSASGAPIPNTVVFFSITGGPNAQEVAPAATDEHGRATFTYVGGSSPGVDQIQATAGTVRSNLAEVTWTPGPADRITIAPSAATIAVGQNQAFTTQAFDRFGNSGGDVTTATFFTIAPSGTCAAATCTATAAGAYVVTATYQGRTATASLIIEGVSSTFTFQGFAAPIDMSGAVTTWNTVKAGQTVPVRWRLTLNGVPVSDPASFVELSSQAIQCGSAGSIDAPVEGTTTGDSGLQYVGDGYWHYNWKTLGSYRYTCRVLVARFSDGTTSPPAFFKFR
jgi:hypothetical protein